MIGHGRGIVALGVFGVLLGLAAYGSFRLTANLIDENSAGASQKPGQPLISLPTKSMPDLSGKVLHWQNHTYSFDEGVPDPKNGKDVLLDIWVLVGPNNVPSAARAIVTYEDGTFDQASLYVGGEGYTILMHGSPALPNLPRTDPCTASAVTFAPGSYPEYLQGEAPQYVDLSSMKERGFHQVSGIGPPPDLVPAQQPRESLIRTTDTVTWAQDVNLNGTVKRYVIQVDKATGRVVGSLVFDASGPEPVRRTDIRSTDIEVFASASVSATLFQQSSIEEACRA